MGVRVVKAYGAERFERRRYGKIMDGLIAQSLRMSRIDAMSAPILESITLLVAGTVVLYAAFLVLKQKALTPSEFIMVMVCLASIGESLRRCGKINNIIQKANAAANRIFEMMDVPVERPRQRLLPGQQRPRGNLAPLQHEVRFQNLTFSYPNSSDPALVDVSLTVPRGQAVAVVGRNGSGKTTLLALLARFYDPQQGRILVDGRGHADDHASVATEPDQHRHAGLGDLSRHHRREHRLWAPRAREAGGSAAFSPAGHRRRQARLCA